MRICSTFSPNSARSLQQKSLMTVKRGAAKALASWKWKTFKKRSFGGGGGGYNKGGGGYNKGGGGGGYNRGNGGGRDRFNEY
jgi:hypothetical protein